MPRKTYRYYAFVSACIVVIVLALWGSQCVHGVNYWLYSLGLKGDPSINGLRIVMKNGWYPLTNTVVSSSDELEIPSLVFSKVDGCKSSEYLVFQKMSARRIESIRKNALVATPRHSWGVADIVEFSRSDGSGRRQIATLKEYGLVVNVDSPEILLERRNCIGAVG